MKMEGGLRRVFILCSSAYFQFSQKKQNPSPGDGIASSRTLALSGINWSLKCQKSK